MTLLVPTSLYLVSFIWATSSSLLFFLAVCRAQVVFYPSGPIYLPVNNQQEVSCNYRNGSINTLSVSLKNGDVQGINVLLNNQNGIVPGISTRYKAGGFETLIITVNTSDTSLAGLTCVGHNVDGDPSNGSIKLTIYDTPDPPDKLEMIVSNNSLMTSWTYLSIPTVIVTLAISLTFSSPSQLNNITVYVNDTDTHTFTLEGVRSCDPFTMCITATNTVGQSDPSCVNKTLPYVPSTDNIQHTIIRVEGSYSLNLTIQISDVCQASNDSLQYIAEVRSGTHNLSSEIVLARQISTIVVSGLASKSKYELIIKSINSLGVTYSEPRQFCTNDVQGLNICRTIMYGIYNIFCDYFVGCSYSGCSFKLSADDDSNNINGFVTGMNHTVANINISTKYTLTVTDVNGEDVIAMQQFNISNFSCPYTEFNSTDATIANADDKGVIIASVISVAVFATLCIIIIVVLCLCKRRRDEKIKFPEAIPEKWGRDSIEKGNTSTDEILEGGDTPEKSSPANDHLIYDCTSYSSLNTPKGKEVQLRAIENDYSKLNTPVYYVREQDHSSATPRPTDSDAPPIPTYDPDSDDSPVPTAIVTNSSPVHIVCAELGTQAQVKNNPSIVCS